MADSDVIEMASLSIRLPKQMLDDLQTIADAGDRPISRVAREAFAGYIRSRKAKKGQRP